MTKHVNHSRGGMTLRSKVLGSASAAAVSVLMLSSAAFAANSPVDSDAPIATNANNTGTVLMAQVAGETVEQAAARRAEAAAAARRAAEDADDDVIVVNGIRSSLEKAIEVKRNADNILDGISAESIGRFPDLNLAESLQRIAGVQIVRDDFRNGQVAIRGISGFSKTQVNGQDLASPNFGGSFVYGIFESSVLGGVDVMKTPQVNMDEGGIAGVVNLKTRGALDFEDDKHLFLSVKGQYEGLNQAFMPDLGMSAGIKNAAGNMGAYVSVGYQEKNFRSDSFKITEYTAIDSNFIPDAFGLSPNFSNLNGGELAALNGDFSDVTFVPKRARYTSRGTTGDRLSIAGGAEWEVSDDFRLKFTGIFAKSNNEQPLNTISLMTFGTRGFLFDILETQDEGQFGTTATSIRVHSPQMQVQNRIRDQDFQTWAGTLDADWEKGPWNVHGAVHYTKGKTVQSQHQIVSRIENRSADSNNRFLDNGLVANLSFDPNNRYNVGFTLNRPFSDINTFGWDTTNTADTRDHLFAGIFTGTANNYDRFEDQFAVQLDVNRDVNFSLIKSIDFGAKFKTLGQDNIEKRFQSVFNGTGASVYDVSVWNNSLFQDSFLDDGSGYFGGDVAFPGLPVPNARAAVAALAATVDVAGLPADRGIDPETGLVFNTTGSGIYNNTQDILAFYANANIDEDIPSLGIKLRGNFGFRYIDTSRVSASSALTAIANPNPDPAVNPFDQELTERVDITNGRDFDYFLPQANLIFDITDKLTLRGSWSKTMNRLNPDATRAGNSVDAFTPGSRSILRRFSDRSQLLPNTATSFDVAAEWYNRAGSTVHGALFTKNIENAVVIQRLCPSTSAELEERLLGAVGLVVGTPAFDGVITDSRPQGECRDQADNILDITRRFNTDDTFRISGAEFGFTQNLDFLDGFWSNFGMTANYTYLYKHKIKHSSSFDTNGSSGANRADQLSLSPHSFNVIPYYETDKFGIRLAGNFRSHFIDSRTLGGFLGADRIVDDRMQWDLSGSYNVTDQLKIGAEVINIFDKDRYEYQGTEGRFRNLFSEGRTMTISASYNF